MSDRSGAEETASGEGRGLFLVFEGVEGAGKSTHLERLAAGLRRRDVPCLVAREPGGTETGERIRSVVLDPDLQVLPETELLLMLAARAQFVRNLVRPALARGEVVLSDRYEMSTFAYQGVARGLGLERVRRLNEFATEGLRPDGLVVLDPGPEGRASLADRMEREGEEFHGRVAEAYRELAGSRPEWLARRPEDVIVLRTGGPVDEVHGRLLDELGRRWPETFAAGAG